MISKLLDFLKPASRRARTASQPEVNDQVLGRLADTDAVYRAMMDHAYGLSEEAVMAALQPKLTPEDRAFLCGRANGLVSYISQIEHYRDRNREELQARQRRELARKQAKAA